MKPNVDLRGIITVLNTPFTKSDEIDLLAVKKNVRLAIEAGVVGILVPAMAAEVDKLKPREREEIVTAVLDANENRVAIIGGASASEQMNRIKYCQEMIDIGCDGVLVKVPFKNETQYTSDVSEICALDPPFLMLQDWAFSDYGIPLPVIVKLFHEMSAFKALKIEVVPAGVKYSEVLDATNGELHVSGGWAVTQMLEALDRGVHAFMPTGMHLIYTEIYRLYHENKRKEAEHLFYQLLPVLAFSNQHLDISIHFFKRLLWRQGIYPTPNVREPSLPFDKIHLHLADALIERVNALTNTIKEENHTNKRWA